MINRYGLSGAGSSDKTGSFANCTGSGCGHLSSLSVTPHQRILHACVSDFWEAGRVTGEWKQTTESAVDSSILYWAPFNMQ